MCVMIEEISILVLTFHYFEGYQQIYFCGLSDEVSDNKQHLKIRDKLECTVM